MIERSRSTIVNSQPSPLYFVCRHIRILQMIDTCAATCAHSRNKTEFPLRKWCKTYIILYSNLGLPKNASVFEMFLWTSHYRINLFLFHTLHHAPHFLLGATNNNGACWRILGSSAAKWLGLLGTGEIEVPQLPVRCADVLGRNPWSTVLALSKSETFYVFCLLDLLGLSENGGTPNS